jgi:hypothetical protein
MGTAPAGEECLISLPKADPRWCGSQRGLCPPHLVQVISWRKLAACGRRWQENGTGKGLWGPGNHPLLSDKNDIIIDGATEAASSKEQHWCLGLRRGCKAPKHGVVWGREAPPCFLWHLQLLALVQVLHTCQMH